MHKHTREKGTIKMRVKAIMSTPQNNTLLNRKNVSFNGRVYMDYQNMVNTIDKCPYSTQESIIGNINTLKGRLQGMPDDKIYVLGLDYQSERESEFLPTYHSAVISVRDKQGNLISNRFELGKTGGSRKDDRTQLASGEEIWQNGFKEVTEKALNGFFETNKDEEYMQNLKKACKDRGWDVDKQKDKITEIADKIEDRGKVEMNKAEMAASILSVTRDCPDEIQESIIGNINTLTARLEEESAKEKAYNFSITNHHYDHPIYEYFSDKSLYITVSAKHSTYHAEYQEEILLVKGETNSYETYCNTNSEEIYSDTFKPLTERLLWDAHRYLPFENGKNCYKKKQILDKLA